MSPGSVGSHLQHESSLSKHNVEVGEIKHTCISYSLLIGQESTEIYIFSYIQISAMVTSLLGVRLPISPSSCICLYIYPPM
jgi:hypothetical protein